MEAAERLLRMLKRKEDAAHQQLQALHGYKAEYQTKLSGGSAAGMEIILLRDFYVFMAKLDTAIAHQQAEFAKASANLAAAHVSWVALRQKVKAYETLASRHAQQEVLRQEKRDQRLSDEAALRKHVGGRE